MVIDDPVDEGDLDPDVFKMAAEIVDGGNAFACHAIAVASSAHICAHPPERTFFERLYWPDGAGSQFYGELDEGREARVLALLLAAEVVRDGSFREEE